MQLDAKALADATAEIFKTHVAAVTAPLLRRLEAVEARPAFDPAQSEVVILRLVEAEVAKIPPAQPGKDADPEELARLVSKEVEAAVGAIPVPQDGKSVTLEDVSPLIVETVEKAVAAIPSPISIRSVVVDRDGNAVFTYSDGSTQDVGRVVGRDGFDADMPGLERQLREMVDAIPKPKDGRDGFNLEDFDIEAGEDGRTVTLKFQQGAMRHAYELVFPVMIDRGVFKAEREEPYQPGDTVTWGGSLWTAQRETKAKPDGPDSGWRLSVKKGRDGKDAKAA